MAVTINVNNLRKRNDLWEGNLKNWHARRTNNSSKTKISPLPMDKALSPSSSTSPAGIWMNDKVFLMQVARISPVGLLQMGELKEWLFKATSSQLGIGNGLGL